MHSYWSIKFHKIAIRACHYNFLKGLIHYAGKLKTCFISDQQCKYQNAKKNIYEYSCFP